MAEFTLPTLVIASDGNRMVPVKHQKALADALADTQCETTAGAGHYPQLERTRGPRSASSPTVSRPPDGE